MTHRTILSSIAIITLLLPVGSQAVTITNGNSFGIYSVPTGTHVDMFGGTVAEFDLTGGTVTMHGGTLGGVNTAFSGGSIDIFGGTINNAYFGGYSSTAANLHVQSVSFNGTPITLQNNQSVNLPNNFGGTLTGQFADGNNFLITVDGFNVRPNFHFFVAPVPEPAAIALLGVGSLVLLARGRKSLK